jgi:tellurite resistance protein TerC
VPLAVVDNPVTIAALVAIVVGLLLVDLLFFARGREPTFRESVAWSIGWFALGLAVALPLWAVDDGEGAVNYVTVYLIERTLSLDNLFVFLLIFGAFAVPQEHRGKLLFWGIALALVMRGAAILVGVQLIEQFHWVVYVLGATLVVLAWRILRSGHDDVDPGQGRAARLVRRVLPVTERFEGNRFFVRRDGRRMATPLVLALASVVAADIAFAVDSIPAAFAITTDAFAIWAANAFALVGLRALFTLVEELVRRFRFLDETIAVVLGIVGVKLLAEDVYKVPPAMSLAIVLGAFAIGIAASLLADRRDPEGAGDRRAAA